MICPIEDFIAKRKAEMEQYPCFSDRYVDSKNITIAMKNEMNQKMKDRYGFIV